MRLRKFNHGTFYCFSPFIMAVTVIAEVGLLLYSLIRRPKTAASILGMLLFLLLATFQAAEYGICEGIGISPTVWAKIGFASISLLPILGMHFIYVLSGKTDKKVLGFAYLTGAIWMGLFLAGGIMREPVCNGNYVIFNLKEGFGGAYFAYYYFWIMFASVTALRLAKLTPRKKTARAMRLFILGYASFTVPATIVWLFTDEAAKGLPSIMCGFALLFAGILGFYVLPLVPTKSKTSVKKR